MCLQHSRERGGLRYVAAVAVCPSLQNPAAAALVRLEHLLGDSLGTLIQILVCSCPGHGHGHLSITRGAQAVPHSTDQHLISNFLLLDAVVVVVRHFLFSYVLVG